MTRSQERGRTPGPLQEGVEGPLVGYRSTEATPLLRPYPEVDAQLHPAELEERVLAYWKDERIFQESVEQRPAGEHGGNEYVFYDGPPFANGLPHYGHLLTGYVKDIVPRYQTMRGRRVERRFGWDCHGLPAEMEAEKQLGISGRQEILEYGIDRFNAHCRTSVLRYTSEWERYVTRQARWVDFEHDYKTMDLSYMESVMWAFKQLWDKGLVYEGYRVMPYSWAAETPLSNFETRLDDAYRPRQDPAITVRFRLERRARRSGADRRVLAWTTTPWTLPSNLALAVGPEIEYAVFEQPDGARCVLGAARRASATRRSWRRPERVGTRARAPSWSAGATSRCSRYFAEPRRQRVPRAGRRLRRHRGGHRRRAHGAGLRRGRPDAVRGQRHRVVCPVDDAAASPPRCPTGPAINVLRGQQADHPRAQGARRARAARHLSTTTTRTAGAPTRRSSTGRCSPGT